MYSPENATSSDLLLISGALFFALLIDLHWRNRQGETIPLPGLTFKSLFALAVVFVALAPVFWVVQLSRTTRRYSVSCRPVFWVSGRPLHSPMMAEYTSKHGPTISPVHLWLSVRITNLQAHPVTIKGYSVESSSSRTGPWVTLAPVSPLLTQLYFASNLKSSEQIDVRHSSLDDVLDNNVLNSDESVRGFGFWECPDPAGCSYSFLRFHFQDASGNNGSVVCAPFAKSKQTYETNQLYANVHGPFDLSMDHATFISKFER